MCIETNEKAAGARSLNGAQVARALHVAYVALPSISRKWKQQCWRGAREQGLLCKRWCRLVTRRAVKGTVQGVQEEKEQATQKHKDIRTQWASGKRAPESLGR